MPEPKKISPEEQLRAMQFMAQRAGFMLGGVAKGYELRQANPPNQKFVFAGLRGVANFLAQKAGIAVQEVFTQDGDLHSMEAMDSQGNRWFWGSGYAEWQQVDALDPEAEAGLQAMLPPETKPVAPGTLGATQPGAVIAEGAGGEYSTAGKALDAIDADPTLQGMVPERNPATGTWRIVPAEEADPLSLNEEIDRLAKLGTPEAIAEGRRLYRAKQQITGVAEKEQQAAIEKEQAAAQAQATQRFNQALQLVDLAQNDPARLDMVLKLLEQSGLWPFDGSQDPLAAVQQQIQQAPGYVAGGFGSQAQRQAIAEQAQAQGLPAGAPLTALGVGAGQTIEQAVPTGAFQPPSVQEQQVPPFLGGMVEGQGIPGFGAAPTFEKAFADYQEQLMAQVRAGTLPPQAANDAVQAFVRQWFENNPQEVMAFPAFQPPGALEAVMGEPFKSTMGTTRGEETEALTRSLLATSAPPLNQDNLAYLASLQERENQGIMTEAEGGQLQQLLAAQGAYQKAVTNPEVEAKTRAFYDQWPQAVATTTAAMQSLEREGRTDNPYYQPALPSRQVEGAGQAPPVATGNKMVDWLKVIQDEAKQRARWEARQQASRVFARSVQRRRFGI